MTRTPPPLNYFPQTASDASQSKIYMSKRNFNGESLLSQFRKPDQERQSPASATASSSSLGEKDMGALTEEQIHALPESSDEESQSPRGAIANAQPSPPPRSKRKKRTEDEPVGNNKRVKGTRASASKSDRGTSSQEAVAMKLPEEAPLVFPDWIDRSSQPSLSQSSQSKKRHVDYSQRSAPSNGSQNVRSKQKSQKREMSLPPDIPDREITTPKKLKSRKVTQVEPYKSPSRSSPRKKLLEQAAVPSPGNNASSRKVQKFSMPDEEGDDIELGLGFSSSTRSNKNRVQTLTDLVGQSSFRQKKKRQSGGSPSSSSSSDLSDLDSIVSVELSQSQKDDLKNGTETSSSTTRPRLPSTHAYCPVCNSPVDLSITKTPKPPLKLSLSRQQDFCHRHQLHDAKTLWSTRNYPNIDWHALRTTRIPSHIPHVRRVLHRKQPSHYLEVLESTIRQTKGNRTKLKKYLTEDLAVDVFKQGYYGPRGAKIMGQALTEALAKPLRMQQKADRTIMTTGISGFVGAVLLPELCLRLVMEDLGLLGDGNGDDADADADADDAGESRISAAAVGADGKKGQTTDWARRQEEARKVMDESTKVGMLLCPDDDHVERRDDDNDDDDNAAAAAEDGDGDGNGDYGNVRSTGRRRMERKAN